jgi:hypothetical protein
MQVKLLMKGIVCSACLYEFSGAMVEHAKCETGYGVNYAWILYTPLFSIILLFIPASQVPTVHGVLLH